MLSWKTSPSAATDDRRNMKSQSAFMGNHTISGADVGRIMKLQSAFMEDHTIDKSMIEET